MATTTTDPTDEDPATPGETRAALIGCAKRPYVPIRHTFVQRPYDASKPQKARDALLATFVTSNQERALDAYMLLLATEPCLDDDPHSAEVWARALAKNSARLPMAAAAVSRTWLQLEQLGLIKRSRSRGRANVRPRREDGKADYQRPGASSPVAGVTGGWPQDDYYFILPHTYWTHEYDQKLSLPGKAMLMIALQATSNRPGFYLPYEKGPQWYGVSADTVERGLKSLRDLGLISERYQKIKAPLAPRGITTRTHYSLRGPFSTDARKQLQEATVTEVIQRTAPKRRTVVVDKPEPVEPDGHGHSHGGHGHSH